MRGTVMGSEGGLDIGLEFNFVLHKQVVMFIPATAPARSTRALALDKGLKILLDALGFGPISLHVLVERTGLSSQTVASM